MDSCKRPQAFGPLDLEIIDRVYEAAWAQLEAQAPFRDRDKDGERGEMLRKLVFAYARSGPVDFDTLCDKVIATMAEPWAVPKKPRRSPMVGA
jgi:hypothetical protein